MLPYDILTIVFLTFLPGSAQFKMLTNFRPGAWKKEVFQEYKVCLNMWQLIYTE